MIIAELQVSIFFVNLNFVVSNCVQKLKMYTMNLLGSLYSKLSEYKVRHGGRKTNSNPALTFMPWIIISQFYWSASLDRFMSGFSSSVLFTFLCHRDTWINNTFHGFWCEMLQWCFLKLSCEVQYLLLTVLLRDQMYNIFWTRLHRFSFGQTMKSYWVFFTPWSLWC